MKNLLLILFVSCLLVPVTHAQNALTNADFEIPIGTADFSGSDWTTGGSGTLGREPWANRNGETGTVNRGCYMQGWVGPNNGTVEQIVPVNTNGAFTFSIWVRHEDSYVSVGEGLTLQWLDASSNSIQAAAVTNFMLPSDDVWHQIHITGTCTSQNLANVRVGYGAAWSAGSSGASFFDNAYFYPGVRMRSQMGNGGLDKPANSDDNNWRSAYWRNEPESGTKYAWEAWANHGANGTNDLGIALWGWEIADPTNYLTLVQNIGVRTGTYSLVAWLKRDADFNLSNVHMRVEWYDRTFTNKVQPDLFTNLISMPNDGNWHEYTLTGTCTSQDLYEARASLVFGWGVNNGGVNRSFQIDDVRFLDGTYTGVSYDTNWCYHGAAGYDPRAEHVPGPGGYGAFVQADYDTTTTTFYVLSDPDAPVFQGEEISVGLRTTYQIPGTVDWYEELRDMSHIDTVAISSGSPFHGMPNAGTKTVDVWRAQWSQPQTNGLSLTNEVSVFYAPYIRTKNDTAESDELFLVSQNGNTTNNLGQQLDASVVFKDYSYVNRLQFPSMFTNGGFENPPGADNLDDTGWDSSGDAGRGDFASRAGNRGGRFGTWDPGTIQIYQDVEAAGGTRTFTTWFKQQNGAVSTNVNIRIEWLNNIGGVVQSDRVTYPGFPDERWRRLFVTGTYTGAVAASAARALLESQHLDGTNAFNEATLFDDAEFYTGAYTSMWSLANGDFEMGTNNFQNAYWDAVPAGTIERPTWAAQNGTYGAAFLGYLTAQDQYTGYLEQSLGVETGTYVFSMSLQLEDSMNLSNAELRIEWYDASLTNKVQADSVNNITAVMPPDNDWHEYAVTGMCNNANLHETRVVIEATWGKNLGGGNKTLKVDDAAFGAPSAEDTDGDGMADAWEQMHFGTLTNEAAGDNDGDGEVNIDEYVADTQPTNAASFFYREATNVTGFSTMTFTIDPSSTGRTYDVFYKTNLMLYLDPWLGYGLNRDGNGAALLLTVTNDAPTRAYRPGALVP